MSVPTTKQKLRTLWRAPPAIFFRSDVLAHSDLYTRAKASHILNRTTSSTMPTYSEVRSRLARGGISFAIMMPLIFLIYFLHLSLEPCLLWSLPGVSDFFVACCSFFLSVWLVSASSSGLRCWPRLCYLNYSNSAGLTHFPFVDSATIMRDRRWPRAQFLPSRRGAEAPFPRSRSTSRPLTPR